jgi:glycosyltransferase involved in cell wall biosynthesis
MHAQEKPDLSIIIPAYNNGIVLIRTIGALTEYFKADKRSFEIICVDDASSSPLGVQSRAPWLTILRHDKNLGQQHAIATGFAAARADTIITTDADMPVGPEECLKLITALDADTTIELALGVRQPYRHRSAVRAVGSGLVKLALRLFFGLNLKDFGCGTNALRTTLVRRFLHTAILPSPLKLVMITLCTRFIEVPLQTRTTWPVESTYTMRRLISLAMDILVFRRRVRRSLAAKNK